MKKKQLKKKIREMYKAIIESCEGYCAQVNIVNGRSVCLSKDCRLHPYFTEAINELYELKPMKEERSE